MNFKDYLIKYEENEHPASTLFHKYVSKNLAKFIVFISLKGGVTPNMLSILSTFSLFLAGFSLVKYDSFILFLVLAQLSYGLDCSDGVVARITEKKSVYGKFLDIALDRINMLIFYASIILYQYDSGSYNLRNLEIVILGFLLYYLYSLLSMIRGLVYNTKRGVGAKESHIFLRVNFEFIDTGIYMFLTGIFLYFNILHILSMYYICVSLLFIFGVFYRSYSDVE